MVRFSDKIAYLHHDMDDAQRAGIITEDDIPVTMRMLLGYTTRERLNTFVHDIIENSMDRDRIQMSEEIQEALMDLRELMFRSVYDHRDAEGAVSVLYRASGGNVQRIPGSASKRRVHRQSGLRLSLRNDRSVFYDKVPGNLHTSVMGQLLNNRGGCLCAIQTISLKKYEAKMIL